MVKTGNVVRYRPDELKRGFERFVRGPGKLPITRKFVEQTDPEGYGFGIVLDMVKSGRPNPWNWVSRCVIKLDTSGDADFAMVLWSNYMLEYVDPVFLDVIKEHATA